MSLATRSGLSLSPRLREPAAKFVLRVFVVSGRDLRHFVWALMARGAKLAYFWNASSSGARNRPLHTTTGSGRQYSHRVFTCIVGD